MIKNFFYLAAVCFDECYIICLYPLYDGADDIKYVQLVMVKYSCWLCCRIYIFFIFMSLLILQSS